MRRRSSTEAQRGFSLLEFLVVTVILAILATFLVPIAAERVRMARIRTSVNQFSLDLRAARWAAVSGNKTVQMTVHATTYSYLDSLGRNREVQLPNGVKIVSSTNPIEFRPNGSVTGGATTTIETTLGEGVTSRWVITTNVLGVPFTQRTQVAS
jgi:prepilin-type N-terminal cleavage/methylation domain-containing protein